MRRLLIEFAIPVNGIKEGLYSDDGFKALVTLQEYKQSNPAGWEVFKAKYPDIAAQMKAASELAD